MPNWSFNSLTLQGSKKDLDKFYSENKSDEIYEGKEIELSFNKAIPRPKDKDSNWYNWNCQNWGTKWDARYVHISKKKKYYQDDIKNTMLVLNRKLNIKINPIIPIIQKLFCYYEYTYIFDTAWAPPVPWLEVISDKYKNIKFDLEYNIEGFDNGGRIVIKDEEILIQENWNTSDKVYQDNKENISNIINEYLKKNSINYNDLNKIFSQSEYLEKYDIDTLYQELIQLLYEESYYISEEHLDDYFNIKSI